MYFGRNSDFEVNEVVATRREAADVGKSGRVVLHLLEDLTGSGRHCITDNWYTSQILGRVLYAKKTMLTGTIKANRGIPQEMQDEVVPQDGCIFMRNGPELVVKFQDRSLVHGYTTKYDASMTSAPTWRRGFVRQIHRNKPTLLVHYNRLMGGG